MDIKLYSCPLPVFQWLLLILPTYSRQIWIIDIPTLKWRWKTTFPSWANYSWIFNTLIMEYNFEHWNTYESRRKLMSKHFILFLFLVPSDSEGFLHTLVRSLSAPGRVRFPMTFGPSSSWHRAGPGARCSPWGSTERPWAGRGSGFNPWSSHSTCLAFHPCLTAYYQGGKTKILPDPRSDKPLLLWFTNA